MYHEFYFPLGYLWDCAARGAFDYTKNLYGIRTSVCLYAKNVYAPS